MCPSGLSSKASCPRLPPNAGRKRSRPPFDFVIVVQVNEALQPILIAQLTWAQFFRLKRWEETWEAYSLPLTKGVLANAAIIYDARK